MPTPLQGVKVLDMTRFSPGTINTWLLADFGADVIRIDEPPQITGRRAEQAAGTIAPISAARRGNPVYNAYNRNKKSIILNLKHPQGQVIGVKLAERSDVLVSEYRPGVLERLGLGYEKLFKLNRRLVYCATTCFGYNGPYRDYPAHDPICLGVAGVLSFVGEPEGRPRLEAIPYDDILTGYHGAVGVLLALRVRDMTGKGQFVDISMLDAATVFMAGVLSDLSQGRKPMRPDKRQPTIGVWQCSDGHWVCTTNSEGHHWANFCRTIGREDFIPLQYSEERREEVNQGIREILLTKTRQEWLSLFHGELESQVAPVNSPEEVWQDPQIVARNMVWEVNHPEIGKVKQIGQPIGLLDTPAQFRNLAPFPGQHTREILSNLGYTEDQIRALEENGTVA